MGSQRLWIRGAGFGLLMGLIIGAGFLLRFSFYDQDPSFPDEDITAAVVGHMRQSGNWSTNWADVPELNPLYHYDQYNFSSYLYANFLAYRATKLIPGTAQWRSVRDGYLVYRFLSAALAAVALVLGVVLAWKAGGRVAAATGGALVAGSVMLVQDAHIARPEAFTEALTLVAVLLCWPGGRRTALRLLGAGFVIGLLVACKVSLLGLLVLPLPSLWVYPTSVSRRGLLLLGVVVAAGVGFGAGAPGALLHPSRFLIGVEHLAEQYRGLHPPHSHLAGGPTGDMLLRYVSATMGWPVIILAVVGAASLWKKPAVALLLTAPIVLFAGYFSTRSVFFERNLAHVAILFFCLAGLGASEVLGLLRPRGRVVWGAGVLVLAAIVLLSSRLAFTLVAGGFSGRDQADQKACEDALCARYPAATLTETSLLDGQPYDDFYAHFSKSQAPLLVGIVDYADEFTAYRLKEFRQKFDAEPVGEFTGLFPGIPTCTLLSYHSTLIRFYLTRGPRTR